MLKKKSGLSEATLGKIYIFISVAILVSFAGIFFWGRQPKPDPETGCVGKPSGSTSIIIDVSEKFSQQTADTISQRIDLILKEVVKPNELVSIYYIGGKSATELKDELNKCRPKSLDQKSWNDANKKLNKQFSGFMQAVDASGAKARVVKNDESSPIVQTIMDVKKKHQYTGLNGNSKRVVIFSDLWENSGTFSMYSCVDYQEIKQKYLARWVQDSPLSGYEVYVGRVPRENYSENLKKCRNQFWVWFLNGAKPIQGFNNILDELPG